MTVRIGISDNVSEAVFEYLETFYNPELLTPEDAVVLHDEIVLAGLQEVISRRMQERDLAHEEAVSE